MHRHLLVALTSVALATGCDSPAFEAGPWHVTVDGVGESTCADDFEEALQPDDFTSDLALGDDGATMLVGEPGNQAVYELDGSGGFSKSFTATNAVPGVEVCFLRVSSSIVGQFESQTFARSTIERTATSEGDCAGVNTSGVPCSVDYHMSWAYVGD